MKMDHTDVSSSSLRSGYFFINLTQTCVGSTYKRLWIKNQSWLTSSLFLCLSSRFFLFSFSLCPSLKYYSAPPSYIHRFCSPLFKSLHPLAPPTEDIWLGKDRCVYDCLCAVSFCIFSFFVVIIVCVCVRLPVCTQEHGKSHTNTNRVTVKSRRNGESI